MEQANTYRGRNSEVGMGWESPQTRRKAEEEGAEKAPLSVPLQGLKIPAFVAVKVLRAFGPPLF